MTRWLLAPVAAMSLSAALLVVPLAGAEKPAVAEEVLGGPTTGEMEEASAEAVEAAAEAAEVAAARAEDAAFSHFSPATSKAATEYPALWGRIARIKATIVKLVAEKQVLRELPEHSKRRKAFLPKKHERVIEERERLAGIHKKIRAKKEAARI